MYVRCIQAGCPLSAWFAASGREAQLAAWFSVSSWVSSGTRRLRGPGLGASPLHLHCDYVHGEPAAAAHAGVARLPSEAPGHRQAAEITRGRHRRGACAGHRQARSCRQLALDSDPQNVAGPALRAREQHGTGRCGRGSRICCAERTDDLIVSPAELKDCCDRRELCHGGSNHE
jgi:hypothetical protein